MNYNQGDAIAFRVNAHRQYWDGTICKDPSFWKCGSEQYFREDFCEHGIKKCFHLDLFNRDRPNFKSVDSSLARFLSSNQKFLDDQIVFFYGRNYNKRTGQQDSPGSHGESVYGVYRVKAARLESGTAQGKSIITIEPYAYEWAVFPANSIRRPALLPAFERVTYMSRMSGRGAEDCIRSAFEYVTEKRFSDELFDKELIDRVALFNENIEKWLRLAKEKAKECEIEWEGYSDSLARSKSDFSSNPFAVLSQIKPIVTSNKVALSIKRDSEENKIAVDVELDHLENQAVEVTYNAPELPEPDCIEHLTKEYGHNLIFSMRVAFLTKKLVILSGPPGVGKSWLAGQIINDPQRTRSEIFPVASTWRGREDLLGYVNPVNGEFEPTRFTQFLRRCEEAWRSGDNRVWLAIFEEFNLSQPEHWLSDLLVRLEFPLERESDRTLYLGGIKISGEDDGRCPAVYLPPSLVIVATVNNDHTVRPLSPRVLDRSALIEVSATGRAALRRVDFNFTDVIEDIVEELNILLEARGVSFSVRSASSLKLATQHLGEGNILQALDYVLVQEVLSKLRLMAGDSRDEELLLRLNEWCDTTAKGELRYCKDKIYTWNNMLQSGRDVFQA